MQSRYDFVYLFDVKDGNPNGDPDAGNLPRVDAETGQGLVTDVCIKRKIRNYVGLVKKEQPPFEIYVKEKAVLNNQHGRAWQAVAPDVTKKDRKKMPKDIAKAKERTQWMCANFFDIRTFGAVMTTGENCGQVRGPIQFGMARSIDPIVPSEHSITRCAVTTEREAEKQQGDNRTMGRKFTVPYGLYRIHGYINPHLAAQTTFNANEDDLDLFWAALMQMFDSNRSAARGEMAAQALIIFKHEDALGNAPANKLFDRVTINNNITDGSPTRSFTDYTVKIDEADLPKGISIQHKI